jgi:hypothetical protein
MAYVDTRGLPDYRDFPTLNHVCGTTISINILHRDGLLERRTILDTNTTAMTCARFVDAMRSEFDATRSAYRSQCYREEAQRSTRRFIEKNLICLKILSLNNRRTEHFGNPWPKPIHHRPCAAPHRRSRADVMRPSAFMLRRHRWCRPHVSQRKKE